MGCKSREKKRRKKEWWKGYSVSSYLGSTVTFGFLYFVETSETCSEACHSSLLYLEDAVTKDGETWPLNLLDAAGKPGPGIRYL